MVCISSVEHLSDYSDRRGKTLVNFLVLLIRNFVQKPPVVLQNPSLVEEFERTEPKENMEKPTFARKL